MSNGRSVPATRATFDEAGYLAANPDVVAAIAEGHFVSGREHFEIFGRHEGRLVDVEATGGRLPGIARRAVERVSGRDLARRLDELEARFQDLQVANRQQEALLRRFHGMIVPPPKHLQERVAGRYSSNFIDSGFDAVAPAVGQALAAIGRDIAEMDSILDFGCGCGRAIIALSRLLPGATMHGTDIDDEAIAWCTEHLGELASFTVAPHSPPLEYGDAAFDLVYGVSVFTHLPEDLQFRWLAEVARVLRPGGVAILTTHGSNHHARLETEQLGVLQRDGFVYIDGGYGQAVSLPDFYQTAMHTHEYISTRWSEYLSVAAILPVAMEQHQDVVVLEKR